MWYAGPYARWTRERTNIVLNNTKTIEKSVKLKVKIIKEGESYIKVILINNNNRVMYFSKKQLLKIERISYQDAVIYYPLRLAKIDKIS